MKNSLILLRYDIFILLRSITILFSRQNDFLMSLMGLLILSSLYLKALFDLSKRDVPDYALLYTLAIWAVTAATQFKARQRLAWLIENTPFSAHAQSCLPKNSYLGAIFFVTVLFIIFPLTLSFAHALNKPLLVTLWAVMACLGGIIHAALLEKWPERATKKPVVHMVTFYNNKVFSENSIVANHFTAAFLATALFIIVPLILSLAYTLNKPLPVTLWAMMACLGGIIHAALHAKKLQRASKKPAVHKMRFYHQKEFFENFITANQFPDIFYKFSHQYRLFSSLLLGVFLGSIIAGFADDIEQRGIVVFFGCLTLITILSLTRVNEAVLAVAGPLGYSAGALAKAYLGNIIMFACGFTTSNFLMDANAWHIVVPVVLFSSFLSLLGLVRLWRGTLANHASGLFMMHVELGLIGIMIFLLPPLGLIFAVIYVVYTIRRYNAQLWIQS